jgi:O-acetyl-ADP-ribose deacetylase (regulator of RNase III)
VYGDGRQGEPELLASAYRRSLEIAVELGLRSMAFPSISTGAYGYPIAAAARVALGTTAGFLAEGSGALDLVRFVLFSDADLDVYETALAAVDV